MKDVMLLGHGTGRGQEAACPLKYVRTALWPRPLKVDPGYRSNILHSLMFLRVENQRGSTSYLLSWLPEVCANNVTKRERTATLQVCPLFSLLGCQHL